jgi:membrane protein DedA with SNARE-associated domain
MNDLYRLLAETEPWLREYGYLALFVAVMVEGIGIPAPGQTLLIGASLLAGSGEMSLPWALACALAATMTGNNLGFLIGRRGGRRLMLRAGVSRRRMGRLSRFYLRYGAWPILLSRLFDGARQLGSLLAGTTAIPWRRFFLLDTTGAALWVCLWGLAPFQLHLHTALFLRLWQAVNPFVAGASIAAAIAVGLWLWQWHSRTE